ncbi:hypothetical protein LEP1GSC037_4955 [Leptospira interrogans str. 2006001854]|uniref:Uncharacterized protein n=1 Tax=Leptospira interrogans str. 2006001854 TaxID=1001590 RepID=M6GH14_LEPIR|nr:hypothetical protein LEP1GSC037_4955 [Leptospira interrogans str. 2006001854]
MEAVEESLNDTAHLLASLLEREFSQKNDSLEKISERILSPMMQTTTERDLNSKIFEITKKKVDLQLYVTDERGIVIYDSEKLKKDRTILKRTTYISPYKENMEPGLVCYLVPKKDYL